MFINRSPIGIDISDASIEISQVRKIGHKYLITSLNRAPLTNGLVVDGQIQDPAKISEVIKQLMNQSIPHAPRGSSIVMSFPAKKTFIDIFRLLKTTPDKKIRNHLRLKARKKLPIQIDDYNLAYQSIKQNKKYFWYLAALAPKKLINQYQEIARQNNFDLMSIDAEPLCLARALLTSRIISHQDIAILDIGATSTEIHIFDKHGLFWSSSQKIGGNIFDQSISQKLNTPTYQATILREQNGFMANKKEGQIMNILQADCQLLITRIKSTLKYFQKNYQIQIQEIILAGGVSLTPGLDTYFKDNLNIKINIANPLNKFIFKKWPTKWHPTLFSNSLGLCAWRPQLNSKNFNGFNFLKFNPQRFLWRGPIKKILLTLAIITIIVILGYLLFKTSTSFIINNTSSLWKIWFD